MNAATDRGRPATALFFLVAAAAARSAYGFLPSSYRAGWTTHHHRDISLQSQPQRPADRHAAPAGLADNLSLGAPPAVRPTGGHALTRGGVQVTSNVRHLLYDVDESAPASALENAASSGAAVGYLIDALDRRRGALLSSSYEYPGRYGRWTMGFVDPPLVVTGKGYSCTITALNERGMVLMPAVIKHLKGDDFVEGCDVGADGDTLRVDIKKPSEAGTFTEEDRSKQPSLFSVVRSLVNIFGYDDGTDGQLGLYGAFGYDLTFQFEPIELRRDREDDQRDLLLYLPDQILVVDRSRVDAWVMEYDFCFDGKSTQGLPRGGNDDRFLPFDESDREAVENFEERDTPAGLFAASVERAKEEFRVGNLFETVLSQTFRHKLGPETPPSVLFRRLRTRNPSPYGFLINLGESEHLVGASPEMFVRCEPMQENDYRPGALRIETCPISGTVARGADAIEDAIAVKNLLGNAKEESELTMCTDVDRNDKSRVCEPGSVKVIGRRQIEMYSKLIHTVDHVEGYLREEFDALDAFLCHTWAVTVTGAPKAWACQFVEDMERSPRRWYGAAVGHVGFDGGLNTGLTLRTVRVHKGVAEVRAGATLLYDSDPDAEEAETELKASAMIDAIVRGDTPVEAAVAKEKINVGAGKTIVLIDHEDSFVHTLGNYLRQTGAAVSTMRSGHATLEALDKMAVEGNAPDMVVLSPGPGNPKDFGLSEELDLLIRHRIPVFGVCLGLQGMVEHFGGQLGVLGYPMHGKPDPVYLTNAGRSDTGIFAGLPDQFQVGRYHSLHGIQDALPDCLEVTAATDDGIVMGIQHTSLPIAGVQFHPESILTGTERGIAMLSNALRYLKYADGEEGGDAAPAVARGAEVVGDPELFTDAELVACLFEAGLGTGGSRSEMILRLALWTHKKGEAMAGRLSLGELNVTSLRDLKKSLGVRRGAKNKGELVDLLSGILQVS